MPGGLNDPFDSAPSPDSNLSNEEKAARISREQGRGNSAPAPAISPPPPVRPGKTGDTNRPEDLEKDEPGTKSQGCRRELS